MNQNIKQKSEYCLNCKLKPCSLRGCPLNNDIPSFIKQVKEERYEDAFDTLSNTTVLSAICGRICPHKKQCQGSCVRGIKDIPVSIGELESFIGDYSITNDLKILKEIGNSKFNIKVAIVGGGPAGLTCGAFLAKHGVQVTIFERYNYLGGLLMYGIPDFRLSKDIVKKSIQKVLDLGIQVKYNHQLGENLKLEYLTENYDYVVLAFGANCSSKMGVEGEDLDGVYGGNELLETGNYPNFEGKTVIINGEPTANVTANSITYDMPYAKTVYYGIRQGKPITIHTNKHAQATTYWDKHMWTAQGQEIVKRVQNYVNRGGK